MADGPQGCPLGAVRRCASRVLGETRPNWGRSSLGPNSPTRAWWRAAGLVSASGSGPPSPMRGPRASAANGSRVGLTQRMTVAQPSTTFTTVSGSACAVVHASGHRRICVGASELS